jgi:hypothetical protein
MNNITPFPPPDEEELLALQCDCGCVSFIVCSDGSLECTHCGTFLKDDISPVHSVPRGDWVASPAEDVVCQVAGDVANIVKENLIRASRGGDVVFIAVVKDTGGIRTWTAGTETEERRAWLKECVEKITGAV